MSAKPPIGSPPPFATKSHTANSSSPSPKILRGIFRKRRDLLHLLFKTATETLQESFRARLNLPDGKFAAIAAIAAIHTFGDYLIFHPHLHVLAADGLFTPDGRFHCMPAEDLAPAIELFRQIRCQTNNQESSRQIAI